MPKTTKSGSARKSELPSTLQKSDAKAQRTFAKTHDSAAEEYGDGERAHRVAYSALKHQLREGRRPLGTEVQEGPVRPTCPQRRAERQGQDRGGRRCQRFEEAPL